MGAGAARAATLVSHSSSIARDYVATYDTRAYNLDVVRAAKEDGKAVIVSVDCYEGSQTHIEDQLNGLEAMVNAHVDPLNASSPFLLDEGDLVRVCPQAITNGWMTFSQVMIVVGNVHAKVDARNVPVALAEANTNLVGLASQICNNAQIDGYVASIMPWRDGLTLTAAQQEQRLGAGIDQLDAVLGSCSNLVHTWVETGRPIRDGDMSFSPAQTLEYAKRAYKVETDQMALGKISGIIWDETTIECWRQGFGEGVRGVYTCDCSESCNDIGDLICEEPLCQFFTSFDPAGEESCE